MLEDNRISWMKCAKNVTTYAQASHKLKEESQQCNLKDLHICFDLTLCLSLKLNRL